LGSFTIGQRKTSDELNKKYYKNNRMQALCFYNPIYLNKIVLIAKKLLLLIICLICFCSFVYPQVIKGIVSDKSTHKVIPFAAIYFSGTTVGTTADESGYFELSLLEDVSKPMTISSVGYYSITLTEYSLTQTLSIKLSPKVHELKGVVISGNKNENIRKENLPIFRKEFLGDTWNARYCKILNENDILLSYNSQNKTLKAFASNPLQIDNKALGYNLVYFLDNFELRNADHVMQYVGNYMFIPDNTTDSKQQQRYENKRRSAYLGSTMHFFRTLWENSLDSEEFIVRNPNGVKLSYNEFVVESDSINDGIPHKYIHYRGSLYVHYRDKISEMIINKEYVRFDANGFFDPLGIIWNGVMGQQRIADLLPFEYEFTDESDSQNATVDQTDTNSLPGYYQPSDQVFLHLDRNLYHPGDTIMFQAYVRNRRTGTFETRSISLYSFLLNHNHETIDSARFRVFNSTASGWLKVPDTIASGNYTVLAYTSRMMNYDPEFDFSVPIRIGKIRPVGQKSQMQVENADSLIHKLSKTKPIVDLRFLPEGGTCIYDIPQRMAFNAITSSGEILKIKGEVINQAGERISEFNSGTFGPGLIEFTPKQGNRYFASIEGDEFSGMKWPLPVPESSGVVIRVNNEVDGALDIRVNGRNIKGKTYLLTLTMNDVRMLSYDISLDSIFKMKISTEQFPAGTAYVTLFDSNQIPLAERLVFINDHKKLNIEINSSASVIQPGDVTELTLNATDHNRQNVSAILSVAVIDSITGYYKAFPISDIESTFLYDRDFYNKLPAQIKLRGLGIIDKDAVDLLLMTYGWRKFNVREYPKVKPDEELMNYDYIMFSCPEARKKDRSDIIIVPVEGSDIITIPLDKKGEALLLFDSLNPYVREVMVLHDEDSHTNNNPIKVTISENKYYNDKAKKECNNFFCESEIAFAGKEEPFSYPDSAININEVVVKAVKREVYANEYKEQYKYAHTTNLNSKDMETCVNFEDILIRYNPYFINTVTKEVVLRSGGTFYTSPPPALFVLDGSRVGYNYIMLADLPASEIASVTILKGSLGYNMYGAKGGIIFVSSKTALGQTHDENLIRKTEVVMKPISLFRTEIEYYIPTKEEIALPEFQKRPTVLWKNEIFLDGTSPVTIRYPNNMVKSRVMVIVNGVSLTNNIGSSSYGYSIK